VTDDHAAGRGKRRGGRAAWGARPGQRCPEVGCGEPVGEQVEWEGSHRCDVELLHAAAGLHAEWPILPCTKPRARHVRLPILSSHRIFFRPSSSSSSSFFSSSSCFPPLIVCCVLAYSTAFALTHKSPSLNHTVIPILHQSPQPTASTATNRIRLRSLPNISLSLSLSLSLSPSLSLSLYLSPDRYLDREPLLPTSESFMSAGCVVPSPQHQHQHRHHPQHSDLAMPMRQVHAVG
jgi:hypothetical protein